VEIRLENIYTPVQFQGHEAKVKVTRQKGLCTHSSILGINLQCCGYDKFGMSVTRSLYVLADCQTFFARQSQLIRENLTRTKSSTKLDNQNAKKSTGKDQLKAGRGTQESSEGGIVVTISGRFVEVSLAECFMETLVAACCMEWRHFE